MLTDIESSAMGNAGQGKESEFLNSGDSDASPEGTPSQFLLIRGLEPSVTEELLAKGVAKLYKPSLDATQSSNIPKKGNAKVASTTGDANLGAKDGSLRRVLLTRDRRTNDSWRYGFAEFSSTDVRPHLRSWCSALMHRRRPRPRLFDSTRSTNSPSPQNL